MSKSNQNRKRIGKTGWLPFWNGSKFNKRLMSKRVRQYNKVNDELTAGWQEDGTFRLWDYSSHIYPKKNYKFDFETGTWIVRDIEEE
jgi:hypothetical protein